jgi:anti-sigma regulatory factor (Ser/Thr protein kinase)
VNGRFHHEALFYAGDPEYAAGTLPEIRAALAGHGAVMVAVSAARHQLLRESLGAEGDRVLFADMEALGRNPARIIPAWHDFLDDAGPGPALGIGEPVWPGRSDAELIECSRHESLLNVAFGGGRPWRLLCPYDTTGLEPDVIDEACRTHPHVRWDADTETSGAYSDHVRDDTLPPPGGTPAELAFMRRDLDLVREFTAAHAGAAGLRDGRLEDLVLAVSELATNSVRHGGGSGVLRTWEQQRTFVCEVADTGRISDPLAGRARPESVGGGGRGLWIVNQLCDLVQVRGGVVRLHMGLI